MADTRNEDELSSQVMSRAAKAGMWLTVAGVILFVAGMFAGMTLDRRLMGEAVAPESNESQPVVAVGPATTQKDAPEVKRPSLFDQECEPGSPEMLDAVAKRVRDILKLNEEQTRQVRRMIDKYQPRMEELRKQFEPELRQLAIEAMADLWPLLEQDQRQRLQRLLGRHGRWLIRSVTQPSSSPAGHEGH
jgi:hypothetical protein